MTDPLFHSRKLPVLNGPRVTLRLLEPHEAVLMTRFRVQNREYLRQWEPARNSGFYTTSFWKSRAKQTIQEFRADSSVCFSIFDPRQEEVIGVCNFTNIIRGTFQACYLGYAVAELYQGQGIMKEALSCAIDYMFREAGLHRIMANYLPHNERSAALLKSLGFRIEGRAERYLNINGVWEDHILTSLISGD